MVQKFTFTYSRVNGVDIRLDIYLPDNTSVDAGHDATAAGVAGKRRGPAIIPSVVCFHGGGLTAGNREFMPRHLRDETLSSSLAFISADYRLLFPYSASHILEDVLALFTYLTTSINDDLGSLKQKPAFRISTTRFAVAGVSAGAYPARLAALYALPRPLALFSLYGTGGDFLSPFYVHQAPIAGWESNLGTCKMFLAPSLAEQKALLPGISDCPMPNAASTIRPNIPGYQARVYTLYVNMLRCGKFLDHLMDYPGLGERLFQAGKSFDSDRITPIPNNAPSRSMSSARTGSSSADLQRMKKQQMEAAVPEKIRHLFPQLCITSSFPPTYLVHGTNDKAVDCRESKEMAKKLSELGVQCEIVLAGGLGHCFDSVGPTPVSYLWNRYAGDVMPFLKRHLMKVDGQM